MSRSAVGNDTRTIGMPGFTPVKINSTKALTASRAQAVLFNLSVPILVRSFTTIVNTAVSTGGDRRILIYEITDNRVDGYYGGRLVFDSGLQASNWASTGARTITPTAFALPPGQYLLLDAVGAFTGSLVVTALNGAWEGSSDINVVSSLYTRVTDCYWPADLTGTPGNPFASGGQLSSLTFTDTNLTTTAGAVGFDLSTVMRYNNFA